MPLWIKIYILLSGQPVCSLCHVDSGKTFQWDSLLDSPPPKVTPPFSSWWTDSLKWLISSLCGSDPHQRRPLRQCWIMCFSSVISPGMWFLTGGHSSWHSFGSVPLIFTVSLSFRPRPRNDSQTEQETGPLCLAWGSPNTWSEPVAGHLLVPRRVGPFTHFQSCQSCGCETHQSIDRPRQPTRKMRWSRPPRTIIHSKLLNALGLKRASEKHWYCGPDCPG